MTYPRTPTLDGVVPPAPIPLDEARTVAVPIATAVAETGVDKKTLLGAIHAGKLPAWWPGGNPILGFHVHRRDLEAWFFNDPSRAHTPGTGSKEGPRR